MINIKPKGFTKKFLTKQMNGLTGNIEVAGFPFGVVEWGAPDVIASNGMPSWWGYEQTGYWLDGYLRCAILLNDKNAINRAKTIVYNVLNSADENGYLGPKFLKNPEGKERPARWAHVVFFRSCMALYDHTQDEYILRALERHYLNDTVDYTDARNVINVEIMLWLYSKTNNEDLLKLAKSVYDRYDEKCAHDLCSKISLSNKKPFVHGVSYNEYSKLGAILYHYTKEKKYLKVSMAAYKKIDRYFMLPDGLHCSNEYLRSDDIMNGHETCNISDYTWSLNYLYEASKDISYLDKIEKCVFNAGLGSVTDDFRALQYFSCVNQLLLTSNSNHNAYNRGCGAMSYRPLPMTACCTGNVNRFMPNYIMNMWDADGENIWLKLYGASEYAYDGIKIVEKTKYPFENLIELKVSCKKDFFLHLRIPNWAESYDLNCNEAEIIGENNGFVTLKIKASCSITISFACGLKRNKTRNGIWFSRGCLVYTYAPTYDKEVDSMDSRSTAEFPAYNICVKGEWAYGISDNCNAEYNADGTVSVEAYKLSNWRLQHKKTIKRLGEDQKTYYSVKGDYQFTPPLPTTPIKENDRKIKIKLIPYGNSLCRVTVFPYISK